MSKKSKKGGSLSLVDALAFWAVILLAIVLVVNAIIIGVGKLGVDITALGQLTSILSKVALAIAIVATVFCSFFAARKKGRNWYIVWIICAIVVVLSYVLGIAIF